MRYVLCIVLCCGLVGCDRFFPVDWEKLNHPDKLPDAVPSDVVAKPANTFGLDTSIPPTMTDKAAALALADVAKEFAEQLRYDGTKESPRVTNTAEVGRLFQQMNDYAWRGTNKLASPEFKRVTAGVIKAELEPEGVPVPLGTDNRLTAIEVFLAVEYGLRQVQ